MEMGGVRTGWAGSRRFLFGSFECVSSFHPHNVFGIEFANLTSEHALRVDKLILV
jgi:hypothetical protein